MATELTAAGYRELLQGISGDAVDARRGDGLEPLLYEPLDRVIIAGLGYESTVQILSRIGDLASRPLVIAQPMQGGLLFHRYLIQQHYSIVRADIAYYRGRYYPTWLFDCFHEIDAGNMSMREQFIPTEFRQSAFYKEWLVSERKWRMDSSLMPGTGARRWT